MGAMTLLGHSVRPQLTAALHERKWDYVVLQELSTLSNDFTVDGVDRIVDPKAFWQRLHAMAAKVRAIDAKPILYMTWKRKHAPNRDETMVDFAYSEGGRRERSEVSPVGRAWAAFLKKEPSAELYYKDGSHPSELGSYVAAATPAKSIAGIDLRRLPRHFEYFPVDLESEKVGTTPVTLNLSGKQVRDAAWAAESAIAAKAPVVEPGPIEEPSVLPGPIATMPRLAGSYGGTIQRFSERPMGLLVEFDDTGEGIATILPAPKSAGISAAIHVRRAMGIRFDIPIPSARYDVIFEGFLSGGRLMGICKARYSESFTQRSELGVQQGKRGQLVAFGPWSLGR